MELPSVMLCLVLFLSVEVVQGDDSKPSKNLLTFLNLLSGYFTNKDQVKLESQNPRLEPHVNNFTVMFRPVSLKKLHDKITFYLEVTLDEKVVNRRILVVSEDCFGVIFFQILNVLEDGPKKPCKPEDVRYTEYDDIRFEPNDRPECQMVFYPVEQNVFSGTIIDCHSEDRPKYSMVLTCRSVSYVTCSDRFAGRPSLPIMIRKVNSYTMPKQFTKGVYFTSPCHSK